MDQLRNYSNVPLAALKLGPWERLWLTHTVRLGPNIIRTFQDGGQTSSNLIFSNISGYKIVNKDDVVLTTS